MYMKALRPKSILTIALVLLLVVSASSSVALAFSSGAPAASYTEILVKFKPGTDDSVIAQVHQQNGGTVVDTIPVAGVQVVQVPASLSAALLIAYASSPFVEYAEPNYVGQIAAVPNDSLWSSQWGLSRIDVDDAWDVTTSSSDIRIAILDTGIRSTHQDLDSKIVYTAIFATSSLDDVYKHGTHVAGTAAAETNNAQGVAGVGYDSSLMIAKVTYDSGSVSSGAVANAIYWAVDGPDGDPNTTDDGAQVINMSLLFDNFSSTMNTAVNYAWDHGVVVVASAGNDGTTQLQYPAAFDNCIAVAATQFGDTKASFSQYGDWIDVAAPGAAIRSTVADHDAAYQNMSGTSMASPHVAGLAALLFNTVTDTNSNGFLNDEVRYAIENTCEDIGVYGLGAGLIDAEAAVNFTVPAERPPNKPSNTSPTDEATGVSVTPTLESSDFSPDPDTTPTPTHSASEWEITTASHDYSSPVYDSGAVTSGDLTQHTVPAATLSDSTLYYWHVRHQDSNGEWSKWSGETAFTTPNQPPNTPGSPSPANHDTDIAIDAALSWTGGDPDAGDTVTYDVYFGTSASPPLVSNDQSATTYNPPGDMSYITDYYWKIIASDNHGASASGPVWDFTTMASGANNPPNQPSNTSPSNGATGVSMTPTLQSSAFSDPDGSDTHSASQWQITTTSGNYTSPVFDSGTDASNLTQRTIPGGTLSNGTLYYWHVRHRDNNGAWSLWSTETSFTTINQPPNTPSSPTPANGFNGYPIDSDLSWTGGDPDAGDTVTYDVYFGTNPTPTTLVSNDQSAVIYDPGTMLADTHYYWKIVATDNHGASTSGPVWDFTTANRAPNTPSNPSPADDATGVSINADLSWTGGDPDAGDTVTYNIYFGPDPSPPLVITDVAGTTYDPGTLSYNTHYYWKIVASDNHGASTSGPVWDFTTVSQAPNTPSNTSPGDGATDVSVTPTLQSSAFSDPDAGDTHAASQWQVTTTSGDYSNPVFDSGTDTSNLTQITLSSALNGNTTHWWHVRHQDNNGTWSDWSTQTPFTTENRAPNTPSNPSPADDATDVSVNADLSWTGGDPDAGDTVTYNIYFGPDPSPPLVITDVAGTTYDPGTLSYNTHYYWKIEASDNHGASTSGPVWDFTTSATPNTAPNTPSNTSPSDDATGVSVTPTLQSSAFSDSDAGDTHTASQWRITTTSGNYSSPIYDSGTDTSNLTQIAIPSGTLSDNTRYYWQVRHQDNHSEWSDWSTETSFTTTVTTTDGDTTSDGSSSSMGLIGGIIGGVAGVGVAVAVTVLLLRRRGGTGTGGSNPTN